MMPSSTSFTKGSVSAFSFRLNPSDGDSLAAAATVLERYDIPVRHLEVRTRLENEGNEFLAILKEAPREGAVKALTSSVAELSKIPNDGSTSGPQFPRSIWDLDKICNELVDIESDMKTIPPGWDDPKYLARRRELEVLALNYRYGQAMPQLDYTPEENETWRKVFERQRVLYGSHACKEYNSGLKLLLERGAYTTDRIPQFSDVNAVLESSTGFMLRPVAGFLSPRHFLNSLAFRVFNATQYVRHHDHPFYTPEPDVLHDLLGHTPLFVDPEFAEFSQELGLASLGASDEDIERLSNVYWYTLEFGQCMEDGKRKAFGAGLMSSNDELPRCLGDDVVTRPFQPSQAAVEPYIFNGFQHLYFVAETFKSATKSFREFAKGIKRVHKLRYNAFTKSVEVLDNMQVISKFLDETRGALDVATDALQHLKSQQ